jgi:hypothetical protein
MRLVLSDEQHNKAQEILILQAFLCHLNLLSAVWSAVCWSVPSGRSSTPVLAAVKRFK